MFTSKASFRNQPMFPNTSLLINTSSYYLSPGVNTHTPTATWKMIHIHKQMQIPVYECVKTFSTEVPRAKHENTIRVIWPRHFTKNWWEASVLQSERFSLHMVLSVSAEQFWRMEDSKGDTRGWRSDWTERTEKTLCSMFVL